MKKFSLLFVALFSLAAVAHSAVYLSESFDDTFLPDGWQVTGSETGYYWVSETNNAGGEPNEMEFYCNLDHVWRLVTTPVDLSGMESVNFAFKLCYQRSMGAGLTIGIATSSGGQWHEAWSHFYNSSDTFEVNETISTEDFGNANVKFCIFFSNAESINPSSVFVDDIMVFDQRDMDIEVQGSTVDVVQTERTIPVGMLLFNSGTQNVTSVEGFYQFGDLPRVEQAFGVNIAPNTQATVNFDVPADLVPDTYSFTVGITKVNGADDDDPSNNAVTHKVSLACATVQRLPLFEHFTSSTCGQCPELTQAMNAFCANNPDKYTYVKYQMNWPSPGDPYYTNEGGTRKTYYGVNAVPWLFMDGESYSFNPVTQADFDAHYNTPATLEIKGSYAIDGNSINVIIDLMPFADLDDVRVMVAVSEKTTYNNVGNNGETSFHHVMMKMLPNAQGTTMSFTAGQMERMEFTQNMASTHVEEMDDLEVAVWIQKHESKHVYNSNFLFSTDSHPYAPENLTLETNGNTMTATWDAPANGNPTGYSIWLDDELVAENANVTSQTFNANSDFHCVQVQAVYADGTTSVKAVATNSETWNVGENESQNNTVSIYPNPTHGMVTVEGQGQMHISVCNLLGQSVLSTVANHQAQIDLSSCESGIYLMRIETEKQTSVQKISVKH